MVSVRKSHLMSETNFEQWLSSMALTRAKHDALEQLWHAVHPLFEQHLQCQEKALEMVEILAELNMDKDALCSAFISPLLEQDLLTLDDVLTSYGSNIHALCQGVRQMEAIKSLQPSGKQSSSSGQVDNVRRMLLAMVADVRAVVIKLAERLCYLRQVKNSEEDIRVLAAKEADNIYAPLANRLGIGQLKWELEDLSFRYLHPTVYKQIAALLDEKRLAREQYMTDFVGALQNYLEQQKVPAQVYGRPKHIFSIWKKMQQKSLDFEQLFDVRAVRVIVEQLQDCYSALGVVHTNWQHLPKEFSDYVATPKANGYQSIHTVVLGPEGKAIEVQIRTQQMHDDAELGVAAHWRYKEGGGQDKNSSFDEKISWLRKILQWQDDVAESGEVLDELRSQVFEDRIYVFTPSGDVVDLPAGSTPLDFAYYIHSNVGHRCIGAKVFGRIVPFTYQLQTGEQVEILTSKTPNPSRDWLNPNLGYIHSSRARAKVQSFFKLLDRDKYISQGKEQLDQELSKLSIIDSDLQSAIKRFNVTTIEDLYAAIGTGNARLQQVVNFLQQQEEKRNPPAEPDPESLIKSTNNLTQKVDKNGITVSGVGNLLTHIAQCCQPVPGDDILGFITQGRGISVHRNDCEQLAHSLTQQPEREIEVQWGEQVTQQYQVTLLVMVTDRQGLLRDITSVLANDKISILGIESQVGDNQQAGKVKLTIALQHKDLLMKLSHKLMQLDDVLEVKRL